MPTDQWWQKQQTPVLSSHPSQDACTTIWEPTSKIKFKSKLLVCNVSVCSQFSLSESISVPQMWWFGAVKYVFQSTLPAGCCYLLNHVTMSAGSKPSVNGCLPRLSKQVPKEKGRQQEWRNGSHSPDSAAQASRTQGTAQAGLFKGGCGCSECVVGGTLAKVDKVPLGLVFQPSSSARSNISCTIVPSVAQPKPRSSSAAQIRTESKFSS